MSNRTTDLPTGPAAAAFLAAGIGCLSLGALTILCESSSAVKEALNWYPPAGALTGKAMVAVALWLVTWIGMHVAWKRRSINLKRAVFIALVLVAIGFLATFPPLFQLAGH